MFWGVGGGGVLLCKVQAALCGRYKEQKPDKWDSESKTVPVVFICCIITLHLMSCDVT